MTDAQLYIAVLLCLVLLLASLLLGLALWLRARVERWQRRRRQSVAARGERDAEQLLRRAGYRVLERQLHGRWALEIDGRAVEVSNRADLLVGRGRQRYVAEVKTGQRAPDPTLPATRRQLLEYRLAYPVDGVLLVDMSAERVVEVRFAGVDWSS